jgi:hypothetical protein
VLSGSRFLSSQFFRVSLPGDALRVEWVATRPEFRRRGLVFALLMRLLDDARAGGLREAYVGTAIGNAGALGVYQKRALRSLPSAATLISRPCTDRRAWYSCGTASHDRIGSGQGGAQRAPVPGDQGSYQPESGNKAFATILAGVHAGRIPEDRIRESYERIMRLKARLA